MISTTTESSGTAIANFEKIIIYGHKLYDHTHSWVHYGFYKAFKYLKFNTFWYTDEDDISGISFSNSLFLTEGQVDVNIPLRNDCFYVLHNCDNPKYNQLPIENILKINVYTADVPSKPNIVKMPYYDTIYYSVVNRKLYMSWPTPLLPPEIESNMRNLISNPVVQKNQACFVGGLHNRIVKLNNIERQCISNDIDFVRRLNITQSEKVKLIKDSKYPLAIVSDWQNTNDYVSDKVIQQISYCGYSITNSRISSELFDNRICYDDNIDTIIETGITYVDNNLTLLDKIELMDIVKEKYTYVARTRDILGMVKKIKAYHGPSN